MKQLGIVLLCVAVAALGLAGGYYAAVQGGKPTDGHAHTHGESGHDDHGHDHGHDHKGHEGHDHAKEEKKKLSPQALKNLGIESREAETNAFVQTRGIAAVIVPAPLNSQPLSTPVGGMIEEIALIPGGVAEGGAVAFKLVRDPFPRPELKLTEELVKPGSETLHGAAIELRRAQVALETARAELTLIQPLTTPSAGDPTTLLPRKTEFDLRNKIKVLERDMQNAREKLELHGVSGEQLKELEAGGEIHLRLDSEMVRRALKHNGLWDAYADNVYAALPDELRQMPWATAMVGELSGSGLLSNALAEWLKREPGAAARFIDIAGLLQGGHPLSGIEALHRAGAFAPRVEIRVPKTANAPDWDVESVDVKTGERVAAGAKLAVLNNARTLVLKAEPAGSELPQVVSAFSGGKKLEATPLVKDGGPTLKDLAIRQVAHTPEGNAIALLDVANIPLEGQKSKAEGRFRSWQLRPGLRYLLKVPVKEFPEAFVLPAEALADDGADKVVFVRDGETFESRKVVLLHHDSEHVVLDPKFSDLFSGDDVVIRGAFGLSLALKAGSGEMDPHAGHNH